MTGSEKAKRHQELGRLSHSKKMSKKDPLERKAREKGPEGWERTGPKAGIAEKKQKKEVSW